MNNEDYDVSNSVLAKRARKKLEEAISNRGRTAEAVVKQIYARVIHDRLVKTNVMTIDATDGVMSLLFSGACIPIHQHAFDQILADSKVKKQFYKDMTDEAAGYTWGKELVAHAVSTVFSHREGRRNLVRVQEDGGTGVVMGFLSDRYRRLDSRPLLDAFMNACQHLELRPFEGYASDTKVRVRAILPFVFEPVPGELMAFGVEFGNSDYGDGGLCINQFCLRTQAMCLAVVHKALRQVHAGSRLPDNIAFSDETYEKDAEATASAVSDIAQDLIGSERINSILSMIRVAHETEISSRESVEQILKRASLEKNEVAIVSTYFEGPDVVNLPPGNSRWRLSNAISWFAQSSACPPERRMELENVAGQLITGGELKAVKEI